MRSTFALLIAYPELQSLLQRLQELPLPQGMSVVDGLRQLLELGEEVPKRWTRR